MSLLLFQVHSTACVTLSLFFPTFLCDHTFGDVSDFFSGTFQCPVHKTDHFDLFRDFFETKNYLPCFDHADVVKLWR